MAVTTLAELPVASSVSGTDLVLVSQSGTTKSATAAQVAGAGSSGVSSVNTRTGAVTLTSSDVGLGSVDNTADSAKPVSTLQAAADAAAQAAAIAASTPIAHAGAGGTAHANAVAGGAAGFMSGADKTKLDGISGTNTGDQTSVTGNAGTATALATARTIDGQSFDGSANITVIAPGTVAATGKTTPVDADVMPLADSAASNVLKKVTWANIKATLKTYFDTLYPGGSGTSTGTNTGDNAVNSLYSSLVSNATHTGDATGATALTVVKINGVALSGLATGILKNTTTTGVPSIAVAGTDYVAPSGALGTPSSGNLSSCTADGTNAVGFLNVPQNSQSAAYTLVLADAGKHLYHPSADTTARVWTIPANSSVAYPIGTALTFINDTSGGVITISITTDTLVLAGAGTTGSRTLAANGMATAIKTTATRWMISGTGLT